jgi:hypothetical protein
VAKSRNLKLFESLISSSVKRSIFYEKGFLNYMKFPASLLRSGTSVVYTFQCVVYNELLHTTYIIYRVISISSTLSAMKPVFILCAVVDQLVVLSLFFFNKLALRPMKNCR